MPLSKIYEKSVHYLINLLYQFNNYSMLGTFHYCFNTFVFQILAAFNLQLMTLPTVQLKTNVLDLS